MAAPTALSATVTAGTPPILTTAMAAITVTATATTSATASMMAALAVPPRFGPEDAPGAIEGPGQIRARLVVALQREGDAVAVRRTNLSTNVAHCHPR